MDSTANTQTGHVTHVTYRARPQMRTFGEAFKHYLYSGGGWVVGKMILRLFPFAYIPFSIVNDAVPVLGWLDDLPMGLFVLYILIQVFRHRDPVKFP